MTRQSVLSPDISDLVRFVRAGDATAAVDIAHELAGSADPHLDAYARWALCRFAPARPSQIWHVDAAVTSADCDGSEAAPFTTIAEAIAQAAAGDTVAIRPGDYRETIAPWTGGRSGLPLTIVATAPGVRVLAMDRWAPAWRDHGDGCWSTPYERLAWDRSRPGPAPGTEHPRNRCEQIWCDSDLLPHLASIEELRRSPCGFVTVDDGIAGELWIRIDGRPVGRIERSVRQQCLAPLVRGLSHIQVRGIAFVGGAAHAWTGGNWHVIDQMAVVSVFGGDHWLIEDCDIGWGDAQGVGLGQGGFAATTRHLVPVNVDGIDLGDSHHTSRPEGGRNTLRRCKVHHHGIAGVVGIGSTDHLLIEDNDVDDNGRKDNAGSCEEAGIKLHSARDCVIRNNRVRRNDYGIWLDCECERNRVTGNRLEDNRNNQLFHELSPGPCWIDSNVVVDRGGRGTGFYTHDGNHCLIFNNAFLGCASGIRVRALFHRRHGDGYTTTCDNRIACNLIVGASLGAVSLMPDKPRNERNVSDGNVLWISGREPSLRQENTGDVGVRWEDTAYGRHYGVRGGGDAVVSLPVWQRGFGQDLGSTVMPPALACGDSEPQQVAAALLRARHRLGLGSDLPECWDLSLPIAGGWIAALGGDCRLARQVWMVQVAPDAGLALWDGPNGKQLLRWHGDNATIEGGSGWPTNLLDEAPAPELTVTGGERADLPLRGGAIAWADPRLAATAIAGRIAVAPGHDALHGDWRVLLADGDRLHVLRIAIRPALAVAMISGEPSPSGNAVLVAVDNHHGEAMRVAVSARIGEATGRLETVLLPRQRNLVAVPMPAPAADAGLAEVRVEGTGASAEDRRLVSFARAGRDAWGTEHDLNAFPDGCFPDGAWAFILYQGTLRASWRARWDADALHVAIDCHHRRHHQLRDDPHGWHTGSAAFVSVRPGPGMPGTELGLALRSDTGQALCGFRKSIDTVRYPIEATAAVPFSISRTGDITAYRLSIPWLVMGSEAAPVAGSDLPFSVMVTQEDGSGSYGLQWFFGIDYHHHENDEAWMGRLRLDR